MKGLIATATAPAGLNPASIAKADVWHFVSKGTTSRSYIGRHSHIPSALLPGWPWAAVTAHLSKRPCCRVRYTFDKMHM